MLQLGAHTVPRYTSLSLRYLRRGQLEHYYPRPSQLLSTPKYSCRSFYHSQPSTMSRIKYNWIDGVESLDLYEHGGYHPVLVGDMVGNRVTALSTSWDMAAILLFGWLSTSN